MDMLLAPCGLPHAGTFHSPRILDRAASCLIPKRTSGSYHTYVLPLVAGTGELSNPTIVTSLSPCLSISSESIWFLGEIELSPWKLLACLPEVGGYSKLNVDCYLIVAT